MNTVKKLVKNYMNDVWMNRKIEMLDQYISSDKFIQHNPHLEDGLEALQNFLPHLFNNMMPNGTWEVKRIIAEDNMVVVHSLVKSGPDSLGMVVVDIFRVDGSKIVEHWDVTADVPEKTASGNPIV